MSALINKERAAHWYRLDGLAMHTVAKADGKGERATTLADARKLNLLPSVTGVLSIKAKPALDVWKIEQAILSALTLPRGTQETDSEFAKRVVVDMQQETERAANWGTSIHKVCEGLHVNGVMVADEAMQPFVSDYERWFWQNIKRVASAELTVINRQLGYAGRVDLVAEHAEHGLTVFDLKTQKVKNGKPVFYPEWGMQLAAYAAAMPGRNRLASVVIDSASPSAVAVKFWDNQDELLSAFKACLTLWQFDRGYKPDGEMENCL